MTLTTRILALCLTLAATISAAAQQADSLSRHHSDIDRRVEMALAKADSAAATAQRQARAAGLRADSLAATAAGRAQAMADSAGRRPMVADSIAERIRQAEATTDSIERRIALALGEADSMATVDSAAIAQMAFDAPAQTQRPKRDWDTWRPKPQRALWLALVIPGGGQIYNRKYWKLPIVYGGFMGCLYALNWNNMMYRDYSQAYLDLMDDDPTTNSFNEFLHLGNTITSANEERYKQIFRNRRDRYRRWRDMSFFCLLGVYALSVIDAYVDAELSEFDISNDLSLKVEPAVITSGPSAKVLEAASFGIQCKLRF